MSKEITSKYLRTSLCLAIVSNCLRVGNGYGFLKGEQRKELLPICITNIYYHINIATRCFIYSPIKRLDNYLKDWSVFNRSIQKLILFCNAVLFLLLQNYIKTLNPSIIKNSRKKAKLSRNSIFLETDSKTYPSVSSNKRWFASEKKIFR